MKERQRDEWKRKVKEKGERCKEGMEQVRETEK